MDTTHTIGIDTSAANVWEIIGPGFADVGHWASAVSASSGTIGPEPGAAPYQGRVCEVGAVGFDKITEELLEYDPAARSLTYRATQGMPGFVTEASNTWIVHALADGRARFVMTARVSMTPLGRVASPLLAAYLRSIARRTGWDLKVLAETGAESGEKARAARPFRSGRQLVAVNAAFSAACGITLAAAAPFWSRQLNLDIPVVLFLGAGLSAWAAALMWLRHHGPTPSQLRWMAGLDATWVLATVAVLAAYGQSLSASGVWAVTTTSAVVALLSLLQWRAGAVVRSAASSDTAAMSGSEPIHLDRGGLPGRLGPSHGTATEKAGTL